VGGSKPQKVYSINNVNDKENIKVKETRLWEINGKTFLILDLVSLYSHIGNDFKIRFYEIKDDLTFTETYQMIKSDGYYGSGTSSIFEFNTFNSYDFLSNGLLFRQVVGDNQVFYTMKEDFIPREVYRINWKNKIRSNYLQSFQKKNYYFVSNGSVFVSDGSVSGSKLLLENNITSDAYFDFFSNYKIENNPDKFFFSFFPEKDFGVNLWITDGTKSGTVQLINQKSSVNYGGFGWGYMYNESLGNLGNKYIFKKPNGVGNTYEVWTTEGTVATTTKLKDANGSILSHPLLAPSILTSWYNLPKINNKLYFSRQTEKNGYEPWVTDGTPEGTKMMGDLVKGIQGSNPFQFVEINQNPYCIATEENKSLQLWAFCSNTLKPMIDVEKLSNLNVESVKLLSSQNNDWKYQWIKDGKNVENATSPTLTTQNSGTYQIKVEDKVGCAFISDSVVVKILQKALANEPLTEDFLLNIYPNPAQDDLNVSFVTTTQGNFEATLYDLYGKIVSQQAVSPNANNSISTKNLNAGTYIFRLSNGEKQSIRKVIKR
jgi:ELWxxDGT repeat protein